MALQSRCLQAFPVVSSLTLTSWVPLPTPPWGSASLGFLPSCCCYYLSLLLHLHLPHPVSPSRPWALPFHVVVEEKKKKKKKKKKRGAVSCVVVEEERRRKGMCVCVTLRKPSGELSMWTPRLKEPSWGAEISKSRVFFLLFPKKGRLELRFSFFLSFLPSSSRSLSFDDISCLVSVSLCVCVLRLWSASKERTFSRLFFSFLFFSFCLVVLPQGGFACCFSLFFFSLCPLVSCPSSCCF